jgi:hypothetical protein
MPRMTLSPEALKEKRKLVANNLDRASTTCLAFGVLGPLAAAYFNTAGISADLYKFVVGTGCWGIASFALHYSAQLALNGLR